MFGFCSSAAGSMLLVGRGLLVEEKVLYSFHIGLSLAWGREKRAFRFWPQVSGRLILDVEPSDNLHSRDKITEVQSDTRWPQEAIQRCSLHSKGKLS